MDHLPNAPNRLTTRARPKLPRGGRRANNVQGNLQNRAHRLIGFPRPGTPLALVLVDGDDEPVEMVAAGRGQACA